MTNQQFVQMLDSQMEAATVAAMHAQNAPPPLGIPSPAVTEAQRLKAVVAELRQRNAELEAALAAVPVGVISEVMASCHDAYLLDHWRRWFNDWRNGAANWPRQQPEAQLAAARAKAHALRYRVNAEEVELGAIANLATMWEVRIHVVPDSAQAYHLSLHDLNDGRTVATFTFPLKLAIQEAAAWLDGVEFHFAAAPSRPTLTPDWDIAPEWAWWWAVDESGKAFWYEDRPELGFSAWRCTGENWRAARTIFRFPAWRDTLVSRPEPQP